MAVRWAARHPPLRHYPRQILPTVYYVEWATKLSDCYYLYNTGIKIRLMERKISGSTYLYFLKKHFVHYSLPHSGRNSLLNMHLTTVVSAFFIASATAVSTYIKLPELTRKIDSNFLPFRTQNGFPPGISHSCRTCTCTFQPRSHYWPDTSAGHRQISKIAAGTTEHGRYHVRTW